MARKLLASRNTKVDEDRIGTIIETLTEKMYSHGHAIGRTEAKELGLLVEYSDENVEQLIWRLYGEYETFLRLNDPLDPEELFLGHQQEEHDLGSLALGAIESRRRLDVLEARTIFRVRRNVPPNPQINLNLNLGLPPGIAPNQLTPQMQQTLQQLINQVTQAVPGIVQQAIVQQSPIVSIEGKLYGRQWRNRTDQPD